MHHIEQQECLLCSFYSKALFTCIAPVHATSARMWWLDQFSAYKTHICVYKEMESRARRETPILG